MADTPNFLRAVELVRQLADDVPHSQSVEEELDKLVATMTRLEYDRLHLYYLRLREGE